MRQMRRTGLSHAWMTHAWSTGLRWLVAATVLTAAVAETPGVPPVQNDAPTKPNLYNQQELDKLLGMRPNTPKDATVFKAGSVMARINKMARASTEQVAAIEHELRSTIQQTYKVLESIKQNRKTAGQNADDILLEGFAELEALRLDADGNYALSCDTVNSLKATIMSLQDRIDENTQRSAELENQLAELRNAATPLERGIGAHRAKVVNLSQLHERKREKRVKAGEELVRHYHDWARDRALPLLDPLCRSEPPSQIFEQLACYDAYLSRPAIDFREDADMPTAADTTKDAVKLMTSQDAVKNQEHQVHIEGYLRNAVEMMLAKDMVSARQMLEAILGGFAGGQHTGPFNMQRVTSRSQLLSAKFNLASACHELDDMDTAREHYRWFTQPQNVHTRHRFRQLALAQFWAGQMLNDNDETVAAVEAWRMARASAPLQGVIASATNRELARLVETQENFVAKANKKAFSKRVLLGYLKEVTGETDAACQMLKDELKANPKRKSSTAYLALTRCSHTQGEVGEVVKYAQKYLHINPTDVAVWWTLGDAFYSRGSAKKARGAFAKCITPDTADPRCFSSTIHLMHREGNHDGARHTAEAAVMTGATSAPRHGPYRLWKSDSPADFKPWWMDEPGVATVAGILEQSFMMVQQEVLARVEDGSILQADASPNGKRIREYSNAIELNLFSKGEKVAKNTKLVPFTAAFLKRIAQVSTMAEGQTKILILEPGSTLDLHTGLTNARIRLLMPLVEVTGGLLTVAGDAKVWVEGEVLAFDDSFEHTARNDGEETHVALLVDIWNPRMLHEDRVKYLEQYGLYDEMAIYEQRGGADLPIPDLAGVSASTDAEHEGTATTPAAHALHVNSMSME